MVAKLIFNGILTLPVLLANAYADRKDIRIDWQEQVYIYSSSCLAVQT